MIAYLDASAVIHGTDDSPAGALLRARMAEARDGAFAISPLVRLEALVRPMRTRDHALLRKRLAFLDRCINLNIDETSFELATHVRVAHGLSTADSIHMAVAGQHCKQIITSDQQILRTAPDFAVDIAGLS